jgi:hypothetical protein
MAGSGCLKDIRIKESPIPVTYFKNLKEPVVSMKELVVITPVL